MKKFDSLPSATKNEDREWERETILIESKQWENQSDEHNLRPLCFAQYASYSKVKITTT